MCVHPAVLRSILSAACTLQEQELLQRARPFCRRAGLDARDGPAALKRWRNPTHRRCRCASPLHAAHEADAVQHHVSPARSVSQRALTCPACCVAGPESGRCCHARKAQRSQSEVLPTLRAVSAIHLVAAACALGTEESAGAAVRCVPAPPSLRRPRVGRACSRGTELEWLRTLPWLCEVAVAMHCDVLLPVGLHNSCRLCTL